MGYSNRGEFYLIALSLKGLECSKLNEANEGKSKLNPFSWFKTEQKPVYSSVYLMLSAL